MSREFTFWKHSFHTDVTCGTYALSMRRQVLYVIILGLLSTLAWGDATVARTLKVSLPETENAVEARSVLQLHGQVSRRETDVLVDGALSGTFQPARKTITLVSLDQNKVHHWEFPQSTFEEMPMSRWRRTLGPRDLQRTAALRITRSWSRVLPEEGARQINGFPCSKFVYEWRFELENTETFAKKQYGVKTTLWLTDVSSPVQQLLLEESAFQRAYHDRMGGRPLEGLNGLALQYAEAAIGMDKQVLFSELTYGTQRLKQITGYPIASRAEWFSVGYKTHKPLFTIESTLESFSLTPLMSSVFSPSLDVDAITDLPEVALKPLTQAK
ncbi:MAG: hypothetical protein A2992_04780 [Elusimicrobia bacterium RIFCSPLOWO2_01_FULL_59_12]|nr:MAG: hypothetical protein A2992_04780 [Elusimicrobia bacterium RIFCSPLOWO2_01_FULL_59_12]